MFKDWSWRVFIRDALFSIAFWQIVLTPYLFVVVGIDMEQYGRWCLSNMPLSAVLGPLFGFLYGWVNRHD